MKIAITVLGFLNGGYMLADGLIVLVKGKYIGPLRPGPWADLFSRLNVDVFRLGPLFIAYSVLWLLWLYGLWTSHRWAYPFGIIISTLTLWYLPVGTIFSLIILIILGTARTKVEL